MRRLLTLLLLIVAVNAFPQNTNPIGLSVYDFVFKFDEKKPDLTEDGFAVQYLLQGATFCGFKDYDFKFSIWCEKDPKNPVYPDGYVTDWSKLQQITFAVSPRFKNDFYVVTAPEKATSDLTITKELKRSVTWRGGFYIYMYNSLFESLAPKDLTEMRFYLRYEIDFHSQEGNAHLTNGHRGERTASVIWKNSKYKLAVKSWLTEVKGSEGNDGGETENGYNLNFDFPYHPVNMPFEVTISFWREKDPLHPLYSNDVIDDFKMMDMMQFTQSTKYPNIIGATWHNEEDYEMVSEYSVQKNEWKPFSIFLPDVLFQSFDPPYIPDDVEEVPVRYYITYHLSFGGDYVSSEQRKLPWVGWKYTKPHTQKVENIGSNDLGDLFGDDGGTKIPDPPGRKPPIPTPVPERKPTQVCDHVFRLIHNPEMYVHKLPTPEPPQQPEPPQPPRKHVCYYYLWHTPRCSISPEYVYVDVNILPDEFYFEAAQHKSLFVRNIEDRHICKSTAVEGLWAAMFPEQEVSRGYSSDDNTPLSHMNLEQAKELMSRMNEYAKHKRLPWEFSVATAYEAKHAGLEFKETDDEDDEAFTADGCFYITAQSTQIPTAKRTTFNYKVFTDYSFYCRFPNCTTKSSSAYPNHQHRNTERAAQRACESNENWCNMRNKETEANLAKLKQQSPSGGDDETPEAQPTYIWYVKDVSYEKCAKCDEHRNGSDVVTLKSFTTKEKAEQYLNTLK